MTAHDFWHDGDSTACDCSPLPEIEYAVDGATTRTMNTASFLGRLFQIRLPPMPRARWHGPALMMYDDSPLPESAYVCAKKTDGGVPTVTDDESRLATSDGSPAQQPTKELVETTDGGVPAAIDDASRLATSDGSPAQQPTKELSTEIIQRINPRLKRLNARGGSPLPMPAYATAYDDERR